MKTGNHYQYKDANGSYNVRFGDRTIEVKFVGYLNANLVDKFCADLEQMLRVIEWRWWGYYGDLTECNEQSSATRQTIVELNKRYIEAGCVVDAFTINSEVAYKQLTETRNASGVKSELSNNLFPNREKALEFIHRTLDKFEKNSAKSP